MNSIIRNSMNIRNNLYTTIKRKYSLKSLMNNSSTFSTQESINNNSTIQSSNKLNKSINNINNKINKPNTNSRRNNSLYSSIQSIDSAYINNNETTNLNTPYVNNSGSIYTDPFQVFIIKPSQQQS